MRLRRLDPWLVVGGGLCVGMFLIALYGDRVAPYEPFFLRAQGPNGEECPLAPGVVYPLGSDVVGRDLVSLLLYGARTTLVLVAAAGLLRLAAGLALALVGARVRSLGVATDALAEILGSFPATLAALLIVAAFFARDTSTGSLLIALAVVGWSGPYRLARAELRRLAVAPFSEGARVVGASMARVLLRHHLPHLVPVLAMSAVQQVAASLVAVAELGVLGVYLGVARGVNLSESAVIVRTAGSCGGFMLDVPDWSGLLASARAGTGAAQILNLYVYRWVFLVPAAAVAAAAAAVSLFGIGVARQYARRDLIRDLRPRRLAAAAFAIALVTLPAVALPPRDADALRLAGDARRGLDAGDPSADDAVALARGAGLVPVGAGYVIEHTATVVEQTGPATAAALVGGETIALRAGWARDDDFAPVLYEESGGGHVEARVAFAGIGVAPADYPKQPTNPFAAPGFAEAVADVADDYAAVDVRGKVVLFFRGLSYARGTRFVSPPDIVVQIRSAISRGAAAVLVADARKSSFGATYAGGPRNPYIDLQRSDPMVEPHGVPVLVVDLRVADLLLKGTGLSSSDFFRRSLGQPIDLSAASRSRARLLDASVRIDLPVERRTHLARTVVAMTGAPVGDGALLVWATSPSRLDLSSGTWRALAAVATRARDYRQAPVVLVFFDAGGDTIANARLVAKLLRGVPIHEVVGIDALAGARLAIRTRFDILVPAFSHYAERSGATAISGGEPDWLTGVLDAFPETPYVIVRGEGRGDERVGDAAALLGYAISRFASRAPELLQ